MTAPTPITCPECHGEQMVGHPAGLLAIRHVDPCSLRDGEDATQAADFERAGMYRSMFVRPATATERTLLAAFGEVPAALIVQVSFPSAGVRRRDFGRKKNGA